MCEDCYKKYEFVPVTPAIEAAADAIGEVYEESSAGGRLHVAIDDWNLGDDVLAYCGNEVETPAERACWEKLSGLTERERATALALYSDVIDA